VHSRPTDTSADANAVLLAIIRATSPSDRVDAAFEMTAMADDIAADGIRARHPDYDEAMVRWALWRSKLADDDLFRAAWPAAPLLDR